MSPTDRVPPGDTPMENAATAQQQPDQAMACYLIAVAARGLDRVIAARLSRYGVTPGQLPTLLALYANDGRTQAELTRLIGVEQPTMAANLQRMERDGLIERRPDPTGGRKTFVHLTDRARQIKDPIRALRHDIDHDALAGLPPDEQEQLRTALAQVIETVQAMTDDPTRTQR